LCRQTQTRLLRKEAAQTLQARPLSIHQTRMHALTAVDELLFVVQA
jgi:hypothetical protein